MALKEYKLNLDIVDPAVNPSEAKIIYGLDIKNNIPTNKKYDAILCAVIKILLK